MLQCVCAVILKPCRLGDDDDEDDDHHDDDYNDDGDKGLK